MGELKLETATQTDSTLNSTNTKKEIYVIDDSMLRNLDGNKLSGKAEVQVRYFYFFPGCTALDMKDRAKPILKKYAAETIIHVGTNNLCKNQSDRNSFSLYH